jgi:hypothetical protein
MPLPISPNNPSTANKMPPKIANVAAKKAAGKAAAKQLGNVAAKVGVKLPFLKPRKAPPAKKKPKTWTWDE